jgi:hypothetical protein
MRKAALGVYIMLVYPFVCVIEGKEIAEIEIEYEHEVFIHHGIERVVYKEIINNLGSEQSGMLWTNDSNVVALPYFNRLSLLCSDLLLNKDTSIVTTT